VSFLLVVFKFKTTRQLVFLFWQVSMFTTINNNTAKNVTQIQSIVQIFFHDCSNRFADWVSEDGLTQCFAGQQGVVALFIGRNPGCVEFFAAQLARHAAERGR
jgi:hypothetical protein